MGKIKLIENTSEIGAGTRGSSLGLDAQQGLLILIWVQVFLKKTKILLYSIIKMIVYRNHHLF